VVTAQLVTAFVLVSPANEPGTRRVVVELSGPPALRSEYDVATAVIDGCAVPLAHTFLSDVDIATGRVSIHRRDLALPDLELERTFRTNPLGSPTLGDGWMHNHELFVIEDGNPAPRSGVRRYMVVSQNGGQVFTCTGTGCSPQRGYHGSLREEPPFVFFRAKAGHTYRFAKVPSRFTTRYYRLEESVTPLQERTVLSYENELEPTRVTRITGPFGALTFFYDGALLSRTSRPSSPTSTPTARKLSRAAQRRPRAPSPSARRSRRSRSTKRCSSVPRTTSSSMV
jgi:hypothetical protein